MVSRRTQVITKIFALLRQIQQIFLCTSHLVSFPQKLRLFVGAVINPNFALECALDALVLGSSGAGGKHRRTRKVRRGFTPVPMLPMTNTAEVSANANFGLKHPAHH